MDNTSAWKTLFLTAVRALDSADIKKDEWTFGGGTALMLSFNHRISYDIDIFLHNVDLISLLSPRLNNKINNNFSDYTEASNFLKIKYPEGEIDFILAPFLTSTPWEYKEIAGINTRVETPEEIIIKKLFYRTELLKIRDIFDCAIVFANRRNQLLKESEIIIPKYDTLVRRWEKIKPILGKELEALELIIYKDHKKITADFEKYLELLRGS